MIRLRALEITDFKNVEFGRVALSDVSSIEDIGNGADVVGLYGQNGSGKTSFIQALSILKTLMAGNDLDHCVREYIRTGQDSFGLKVEFFAAVGDDEPICDYINGIVEDVPEHIPYLAVYEVHVGVHSQRSPLVLSESLSCKNLYSDKSVHEVFAWSVEENDGEADRRQASSYVSVIPKWVEGATEQWSFQLSDISPTTHWQSLIAADRTLGTRLEAAKNQSFHQGSSFLFSTGFMSFSRSMLSALDRALSNAAARALTRVCVPSFLIATSCRVFAIRSMVVLPTVHQGILPLGYLPLASHEGERAGYVDNFMLLDIDTAKPVEASYVAELEHALDTISEVVGALVPGLAVEVERRGEMLGVDGERLVNIELVSVRGNSRVPLRNESEGIKKVLSVISLLIDVHSNPAALVAIDEFDSGVFEFLLGEILHTIAERGCGQFVFTAHNLRPLEVLSSDSIWLTTIRPDRRYIKAVGMRGSNNLRKMYLRDVRLGRDGDDIYVPTSSLRIDSALYDAGVTARKMRRSLKDR